MNPVKAKLACTAVDWPGSSTPAHFRRTDDGLVTVKPLLDRMARLDEFLDMPPNLDLEAALAKGHTIGRPLMDDQALAELEKRLGRPLRPGTRGRRASPKNDARQLRRLKLV